jgi:hypothetical protein
MCCNLMLSSLSQLLAWPWPGLANPNLSIGLKGLLECQPNLTLTLISLYLLLSVGLKGLLEVSGAGYLAANSASAFSMV